MKKFMYKSIAGLIIAILFTGALAGCSASKSQSGGAPDNPGTSSASPSPAAAKAEKKIIKVGSKGFAENQIVAKLVQFALEDGGYSVEFVDNLDGDVLQTAVETGAIDLYPEYTNTGIVSILKLDPVFDTEEAYKTVKEKYKEKFNIKWLEPTNINDTYCLVLNRKTADQYGIKTISDLQKQAGNIRAAQASSWEDRPDHLPALRAKYGEFNFKESKIYSAGLKYEVLLNNEGDLTLGYTTDPQLENKNLVALVDDKQVWPPYYLVPIVKQEALDKYPDIEEIINNISKKLDTEAIIQLSASVTLEHDEFEDVAKAFYDKTYK